MTIDLNTAKIIIAAARAAATRDGLKPVTVTVLDSGGHVVAVEREDGSSIKRFEIAFGKAHGALSLGMGSRARMERAEQQPYFTRRRRQRSEANSSRYRAASSSERPAAACWVRSACRAIARTTTKRLPLRGSKPLGSCPRSRAEPIRGAHIKVYAFVDESARLASDG
jgi:Haem-degrading